MNATLMFEKEEETPKEIAEEEKEIIAATSCEGMKKRMEKTPVMLMDMLTGSVVHTKV